MAGDIGIREQVIILPPGRSLAARDAGPVPHLPGQTVHSYGPRVAISSVPPGAEPAARGFRAAAVLAEEDAGDVSADVLSALSAAERMGVQAFSLRQSAAYAEAKADRPHQDAEWDSGVADQPGCHVIAEEHAHGALRAAADGEAGAPTSARLTGSVAVGIVIVEGPTAALKFSAAERVKVVAEVQNGLGWLGSQNPEGVTFHYDIQVVTLTVAPGAASLSFDQKETLWRDPAMKKLGYGTGMAAVTKYVETLRTNLKTTWGYCAFFTKYPLGHFAYASIGGPRLVMDYANDGWGPDNIDRVFAHETGHVFGAPDEYAASGCGCGGSWGFYGKPNGNCANCAPGGGVECLMKQNSWAMCTLTPYHLGFPLVAATYTGVWRAGTDGYYLWANASWNGFKAKWEELAKQNLRLIDIKIARVGAEDRFWGVWRQGTGGHYLWVNATWESFKAKWEELSKQNLRLVDIEVMQTPAGLRYTGVWLPGTGGHYLWVNLPWAQFKLKWEELAKKNMRLHDIAIVKVGGEDRFTGVWREGTGGHYLWVNAEWPSFKAKWEELGKANLRLVDVEVTQTAGGLRYTGVWLPGTDGYYLWANASWQSFRAKWEELGKAGQRLIDIDVTIPAGALSPGAGAEEAYEAPPARSRVSRHLDEVPEPAGGGGGGGVMAYQMAEGPRWTRTDDGEGGGEILASRSENGRRGEEGRGGEDEGFGGGDLPAMLAAGDEDGYGGGEVGFAPEAGAGGEGGGYGGGEVGEVSAAAGDGDGGGSLGA